MEKSEKFKVRFFGATNLAIKKNQGISDKNSISEIGQINNVAEIPRIFGYILLLGLSLGDIGESSNLPRTFPW